MPNAIAKCIVPVSFVTNKSISLTIEGNSSIFDFPHILTTDSGLLRPWQNSSANLISFFVAHNRTNLNFLGSLQSLDASLMKLFIGQIL